MKGIDIHMQFEFYVLNYNNNKQKIEMYNIFNNIRVQEYTEKAVKKYLRSPKNFVYKSFGEDEEIYGFDALVKEIDSIIIWQEKGRSEYEIGVSYAFDTDCDKLEKIDCWYQAHANILMITHEVIRQYKEQVKEKVSEDSKTFIHEFNENQVIREFLESCEKAAKLFRERDDKK